VIRGSISFSAGKKRILTTDFTTSTDKKEAWVSCFRKLEIGGNWGQGANLDRMIPLPICGAIAEELRPTSGRAGAAIGASRASRTPECGASPLVSTVRSPFAGSPGGGTLPAFLLFKIFILLSRPFA
jgi:hypothetical protein